MIGLGSDKKGDFASCRTGSHSLKIGWWLTLMSVALTFCHPLKLYSDWFHYRLSMTLKSYHPWRPPLRSKQQWVPRSKSCRIKSCFTTLFQCIFFWKDYSRFWLDSWSPHRNYPSIPKEIAQLTAQKLSQYFDRNCSTHHTEIILLTPEVQDGV